MTVHLPASTAIEPGDRPPALPPATPTGHRLPRRRPCAARGRCDALTPEAGEDGASLVAAVRRDPDLWTTGHLTAAAGALLLLAGLAHLASRLPYRARAAATGLTWFALGTGGQALLATAELLIVPVSRTDDTAAAVAAVDRISESTALAVVFLAYLPGVLLGGLLLFVGLRLCGVVSTRIAGLGVLAVGFGFFAEDLVPAGDVITAAALAAALVWPCAPRPRARPPVPDVRGPPERPVGVDRVGETGP